MNLSDHFPLWKGLSPHARGSRPVRLRRCFDLGSIPACTGEPCRRKIRSIAPGVYPRMHGGATLFKHEVFCEEGLSPHARGSLISAQCIICCYGSIPACTGEPMTEFKYIEPSEGLSPHARGSLAVFRSFHSAGGSIPACTGEPNFVR